MTGPPEGGEDSERLPELYLDALELDAEGRRERVARVAAESPELARELARLLAAEVTDPSPIDFEPERPGSPPVEPRRFPERVGPYRIERELGQGGMGRVFLATQESPHFRRTVALKLIDPGRLDETMVRRFRDEVRILAALEHPGIVRFLNGGRSGEGIWFLALEYVEGLDLLAHAQAHDLDAEARVRLFLPVVEAVEYAHERGVVHRDLKPSNILVDGEGRPRLLDFGISKLVDPESGAVTATMTATAHRPLTPAYASPEQIAGAPANVASDVFSLGVVLYELLAGRRPFAFATPAGMGATPPTPSTAAGRGSASPASRRRRFKWGADLDAICMKALAPEPGDRYASAGAFAGDLRAYLDGRPPIARAAASGGRGRGAIVLVALVAGLALAAAATLWQRSRRASPSRATAAGATAATRGFPFDPSNPPAAEECERRLAAAPDDLVTGAALVLRLVRDGRREEARIALGRMRQVPGGELDPLLDFCDGRLSSLAGDDQRALVFYTRARDRAAETGRSELLGAIRTSRAATLSKLGQRDAAIAELEAARLDSEREGDPRTLYRTMNGIFLERMQRGETVEGKAALEAALAAARTAGIPPTTTLENLSVMELSEGRPDLALPRAEEILAIRRDNRDEAGEGEILKTLSQILRDLGRGAEAEPLARRSLELLRPLSSWNVLADSLWSSASSALEDGDLAPVDAWTAELEALSSHRLTPLALGYARSLAARKAALTGDLVGARAAFAEARKMILADGNPDLAAMSDLHWAWMEARAGDAAASERVLAAALAPLADAGTMLPGFFAATIRARSLAGAGRFVDAERELTELGPDAATSPSLSRRLAFLAARGVVAGESASADGAADLDAAIELARSTGRKVDELEARIDRARLYPAPESKSALEAVIREADAAGLTALSSRARAVYDPRTERSRN